MSIAAMDELVALRSVGRCSECGDERYVYPLHLEGGGRLVCLFCAVALSIVKQLAVGGKVLARFGNGNAARKAQGDALKGLIDKILEELPPTRVPTAKDVLARMSKLGPEALSLEKLPSLRTVQWHMRALRRDNIRPVC